MKRLACLLIGHNMTPGIHVFQTGGPIISTYTCNRCGTIETTVY